MKKMKKIIYMTVLVSFIVNTIMSITFAAGDLQTNELELQENNLTKNGIIEDKENDILNEASKLITNDKSEILSQNEIDTYNSAYDSSNTLEVPKENNLEKQDIKQVVSVKSILNLDTSINGNTFDKTGIHIEGWKLATVENTEIKVYVDGKEIDENNIKYSYKYDLISIVQGYGTYKENPEPNFDIDIPIDNISHGQHTIEIKLVALDGSILQSNNGTIYINKQIKSILNIDTALDNYTFNKDGIHIEGWKLSTIPNTKLKVFIDGQEIDESNIKYSYKYDLISIVSGYGTYKENPAPNFDIDIHTTDLSEGKHILNIKFISSDETIIFESIDNIIYIKKDVYKGIDVSEFNGNINWSYVKNSGINFAMIRLGYRGYRTPRLVLDSTAIRNIKAAQTCGVKVGVYFVTQAITVEEAQEEALWVIGVLDQNGISLDYPVAIDTEYSTANTSIGELPGRADLLDVQTRTMVCKAFCDVIEYNGRIPMIYASTNWFEQKLDLSQLSSYDIWLANYSEPRLSIEYDMWQYTSSGAVIGVPGRVDLNFGYKNY